MFAHDPNFWLSLRNTIWIVAVSVPLAIALGVGSAYVLTKPRRGRAFYRTAFFLPTMVPAVAAAVAFLFLLNAGGPIDHILGIFHLPQPLWFLDAQWSKPGLVVIGLWGVGSTMIIFLAALLDVPRHLYESAQLDGAGALQRLRWVTLPAVSPVLLFAVVIGVIEALQYFTQAYVASSIVGGGAGNAADPANRLGYPEGSTMFYPLLLYQQGFRFFNMGYASAMAIVLLVVAFAVTAIIIRNTRRWVHYQAGMR
jgi:multiple sugar transport system permease protein